MSMVFVGCYNNGGARTMADVQDLNVAVFFGSECVNRRDFLSNIC